MVKKDETQSRTWHQQVLTKLSLWRTHSSTVFNVSLALVCSITALFLDFFLASETHFFSPLEKNRKWGKKADYISWWNQLRLSCLRRRVQTAFAKKSCSWTLNSVLILPFRQDRRSWFHQLTSSAFFPYFLFLSRGEKKCVSDAKKKSRNSAVIELKSAKETLKTVEECVLQSDSFVKTWCQVLLWFSSFLTTSYSR